MPEAEEILIKLVKQIAKEQNFNDYIFKIEPISSGGANYTSKLFNVTIEEKDNVIHLFAKVAAVGDGMRNNAPKYFETENIAFNKILKVYEQLQNEHQVPDEHKLIFPKFYGSNSIQYEETIILEDLTKSGYQPFGRFKPYDWEYAKSTVTELAKMHALSFAYGEYYMEEYNKLLDIFKFEWDTESDKMLIYAKGIISDTIENTREENKDKLKRYFEDIDKIKSFPQFFRPLRRPVLGHGDFKPSNLMHRNREDGSVDIKIVDLQTLQGVSPVVDLLYFIFAGSDEEFRSQHYEKLLDHYYTELEASMKRLHLNPEKIYSREDFEFEMKEKLPSGLILAVFTLPIVTVEANNAPKVDDTMDITSFSVDNNSQIYKDRLNGVVNDYVKWGILK